MLMAMKPVSAGWLSIQDKHWVKPGFFVALHQMLLSKSSRHSLLAVLLFGLVSAQEGRDPLERQPIHFGDKNNPELYVENLYNQGNTLYGQSKFSEALPLFLKIDSVSKTYGIKNLNTVMAQIRRAEITKLAFTKESSDMAYHMSHKALEDAREIESLEGIHTAHIQLADLSQLTDRFEESKRHIDKALRYYLERDNQRYVSRLYLVEAAYYDGLGNLNEAKSSHLKRLQYIKAKSDSSETAKAHFYYGNFLRRKMNDCSSAIVHLEKAKEIFEKIESPNSYSIHKCARDLAICYEESNAFELAAKNYRLAYEINIDLNQKANRELSRSLESKYQSEQKEQEIALLKSQNELAEQKQKSQRNFLLGGIGFTSLAGVFLFLLYRNRQKTTKRLKELDTAKSNFFANISHELRTPLSLIRGPVEQQLENANLSQEDKQNLGIAKNNTERLTTLVDQLLDLSKLESGFYKLNISKGLLSSFLKSQAESFLFRAKKKSQLFNIKISIDENYYWYDNDVLQKVVGNLLSNALKYSPDKSNIDFKAEIKRGNLLLSVQNTGISLTEDEIEEIFNRFHRSHENETGTGIGLALTKELVELHKGNIKAESNNDSVTFNIQLPIHEAAFSTEEKGPQSEPILPNVADQKHATIDAIDTTTSTTTSIEDRDIILIVDDNKDLRTYVSSIFGTEYKIIIAENGSIGFQKALKQVPDLIITDLMMPKDDGLKLTENCKTNDTTSHIPIIMLTAKVGDENRLEGLETGADAYLTKPFNNKILIQTAENLLESRKKLQKRFSQEVILTPKEISISSYDERFLNTLQNVMDNQLIKSDFSAEAFAEALGMSRMQLHRKLKALTGQTTTEFIRSQRLKLAASLLQKSDVNISEIGYQVGFNDHSYFTKCFRETYGCSPTEFSKKESS